jgi:uncharacterized protein
VTRDKQNGFLFRVAYHVSRVTIYKEDIMKPIWLPLLAPVIFFALLFLYTKVAGPLPLSVNSVVTQKTDTFSVSGEGKASITPDIAIVSLGVQTQGALVKTVQNDLNTRANAVVGAIKELGISASDIQTANYSIYPTYDYRNGSQKITGYTANTTVTVKVKDFDKVNTVIDTATEKGANTVNGVSFDVSDKTKAEDEARTKAVAEAKKKAEQASHIAGFSLGKIINYTESEGGIQPRPMMAKVESAGFGGAADTQIEAGSSEITISVSLSYQIQ